MISSFFREDLILLWFINTWVPETWQLVVMKLFIICRDFSFAVNNNKIKSDISITGIVTCTDMQPTHFVVSSFLWSSNNLFCRYRRDDTVTKSRPRRTSLNQAIPRQAMITFELDLRETIHCVEKAIEAFVSYQWRTCITSTVTIIKSPLEFLKMLPCWLHA